MALSKKAKKWFSDKKINYRQTQRRLVDVFMSEPDLYPEVSAANFQAEEILERFAEFQYMNFGVKISNKFQTRLRRALGIVKDKETGYFWDKLNRLWALSDKAGFVGLTPWDNSREKKNVREKTIFSPEVDGALTWRALKFVKHTAPELLERRRFLDRESTVNNLLSKIGKEEWFVDNEKSFGRDYNLPEDNFLVAIPRGQVAKVVKEADGNSAMFNRQAKGCAHLAQLIGRRCLVENFLPWEENRKENAKTAVYEAVRKFVAYLVSGGDIPEYDFRVFPKNLKK